MTAFNKTIASKTKEVNELKDKLVAIEEDMELYEATIQELENKNGKFHKDRKLLEIDTMKKSIEVDSVLRQEMEKGDNLEILRGSLERELKQEKENLRKALR